MKRILSAVATAPLALGLITVFGAAAHADGSDDTSDGRSDGVVFVQNDDPAGNRIFAYDRRPDGTLELDDSYATGGNGGILDGAVVDNLASQGSLVYDSEHRSLYAVNAGSDTVSVFSVRGDQLHRRQIIPSFGDFPVSIAVHDNLVYVLNALDGGSVQGYRAVGGILLPLIGSHRDLGLDPNATPQFTTTPGQVEFSPDGSQLLVTTKGNTNAVDTFEVGRFGRLSDTPVVNLLPGKVPFALAFDPEGHVVLTEAGPNAVESFELLDDGTLNPVTSVATGQAATCWIVFARGNFYVSNAGSGTLTRVQSLAGGGLAFIDNTSTDAGTVDAAVSLDERNLYVQAGGLGIVDEFTINDDGSLTFIGSVTVPNAVGGEGIVAI
jgi:6-phosphogluconolactonase (cycloisomerase 2 family)